jgi:hypothetical protein
MDWIRIGWLDPMGIFPTITALDLNRKEDKAESSYLGEFTFICSSLSGCTGSSSKVKENHYTGFPHPVSD